jgi:hypothetical protein
VNGAVDVGGPATGALAGGAIGARTIVGRDMGAGVGLICEYLFTSIADIFGKSNAGTFMLNSKVMYPSMHSTGEMTFVMALKATLPPICTISTFCKMQDVDNDERLKRAIMLTKDKCRPTGTCSLSTWTSNTLAPAVV